MANKVVDTINATVGKSENNSTTGVKFLAWIKNKIDDKRMQKVFAREVLRRSDKYTPFDTGAMKNTARIINHGRTIEYPQPYAIYQWYGKGMRKYSNNDNGLRGKMWVNRMWANESQAIIREIERTIK